MKKVLFITDKIMHYRIPVYNYLSSKFKESGYEMTIITTEYQEAYTGTIDYKYYIVNKNLIHLWKLIEREKPDFIITFLVLRSLFLFPLLLLCKSKKIPIGYWAHGINIKDPNNRLKRLVYNFIHTLSNAIILYSPNEKRYISQKNMHKIFIAYNTLNFYNYDTSKISKEEIKNKYGIRFKQIVLFVGRIQERKNLELLINVFKNNLIKDTGLVIVGPGLTKTQKVSILNVNNIKYLGAIYDENEVNTIFRIADIFSIPGQNGLGINQAMFWGLPCVTIEGFHGPEIFYLKNKYNGIIAKDDKDYEKEIIQLCQNREILEEYSKNASLTMKTSGSIDRMFEGFLDAVQYMNQYKTKRTEQVYPYNA